MARLLTYSKITQHVLPIGCVLLIGFILSFGTPEQKKTLILKKPTSTVNLPQALNGLYKWDKHGFLINFRQQAGNHPPLIRVYASQGKMLCQISPLESLPDSPIQGIGIDDVAITNDGSVLVAITAATEREMANALLMYDGSGKIKKVIKTDPYSVEKIAVDDENNIWLLGYDWEKFDNDLNWPLIRKISPDGVPLLSTLPRSLFAKEKDPFERSGKGLIYSEEVLEVINDKVHAWLPGVRQIAVFDLQGRIVRTFDDPLRSLLKDDVEGLEVLFFIFLPEDQLVIQANVQKKQEAYRVLGGFFSGDGGQSWCQIEDKRETPRRGFLAGFTSAGESVITRPAAPGEIGRAHV